jgi:flagellar biosynthesis anti-sigma factor FlgM
MKKSKKQGPGNDAPPAKRNRKGTQNGSGCCPPRPGASDLQRNDKLMDQVRQIIAETPEVRADKVEPLQEAVASGTYEIDARKLANCLITKLILES